MAPRAYQRARAARRGVRGNAPPAFASLLLLAAAALAALASGPAPATGRASANEARAPAPAASDAAPLPPQAAGAWTRLGPAAGVINDIAESPSSPSVVYAAVDVESGKFVEGGNGAKPNDGVYKSADGGLTWAATALLGKRVLTVAVDPTNADTVYAGAARQGVFRSRDGGKTWDGPYQPATAFDFDAYALAVHPQTPSTVYVSYPGRGLFRSTDGGINWAHVSGLNPSWFGLFRITFDPKTPATVYAASAGPAGTYGVFKSLDDGQTWSRVSAGLPPGELASAVAVAPSDASVLYVGTAGAGVYKSTNGGQSWAAAGAGLPNAFVVELSVDPANPAAVLAATTAGIYKTADAGQTWARAGNVPGAVISLARLPGDPPALLAGTRGIGFYRSADAGATWSPAGAGLPRPVVRHLAVSAADPATVYAGSDEGLYQTGDRGGDWSITLHPPLGRPVLGLAADPLNTSTLYAGVDYAGVFKSADGGATWSQLFLGNSNLLALAIAPSKPSTLYWSLYPSDLYRTTDGGGMTFEISSPGVTAAIAVDPTNSQIVYAGTSSGVAKSTAGGPWAYTSLRAPTPRGDFVRSLTIDPNNPSTLYATLYTTQADPRGAFRSADAGLTWQQVFADAASQPLSIAVKPGDPDAVFAGTSAGVVRSADGGLTSQPFSEGMPEATAVHALAFDAAGQHLYAGTSDGVFRAEISTCGYVPTPKSQSFTAAGGAGTFDIIHLRPEVTGPGGSGCPLSAATSAADWITINSVSETTAGVSIGYAVAPNEGNARGGVIRIRQQVFHVTQEAAPDTFAFAAAESSVGEGDAAGAQVTITRRGDATRSAAVTFATIDDPAAVPCDPTALRPDGTPYPKGAAYARCDYATTVDTVIFRAGETARTVRVPLVDDGHAEGAETFRLALSLPGGGAPGSPSSVLVTINDNDAAGAPNPIRGNNFFVRQQYLDFLSREPEQGEPWTAVLDKCPDVDNSPGCDRVLVSQSFFQSPEFQLKGFFVYNFYKVAFGRLPLYAEITPDMRGVSGQTPGEVFDKRYLFAQAFAERPEFKAAFDSKTNAEYVAALAARYSLERITTQRLQEPDGGQKLTYTLAELASSLDMGFTRAQILRAFVQSDEVGAAEFRPAFVAMQYFGYLRRDAEPTGYQAWLSHLEAHPGDYRTMVHGFVNSPEYALRFGRR